MSDDPPPKVVSLFGDRLSDEIEVDPNMISVLEGLLEHARTGRIKGVAVAVTFSDGTAQTAWSDLNEGTFRMAGVIALLAHRYNNHALVVTEG